MNKRKSPQSLKCNFVAILYIAIIAILLGNK